MKKIVALVVALLIPMSSASADILSLDNHNIGTLKNHVKFVPTIIDKNSPTFTFQIFIDNSMKDIDMLYLSLFNCNGGLIGYKRVYADKYGWDNFEDTYGGGKSTILKSFVFNNNPSYIPAQCIWESYRMQVSIWQVGMDNSTNISRATSGKYITNVIDVPINGQPFSGSLAIGVPDWKNPYAQTTPVPTPTQPSWIQSHIEEINKIAEGWKKATEALEANQKAEALRLQIKATSGTACTRAGAAKYVGNKRFVCTKQNKKLVWR